MVARKAQMFVVTAVFLASMLFVVQEMFITYSVLDTSEPFETNEIYVMNGIIKSVNDTIGSGGDTPDDCQDFKKNIDELLTILKYDASSDGYLLETGYRNIDCSEWMTKYPGKAPLSLSIRLSETYDISGNVIDFYHNQ